MLIRNNFNYLFQNHENFQLFAHIKNIFKKSNIEYTIIRNDIFNENEIELWENNPKKISFIKKSLNLDQLIINFNKCLKTIEEYGFYPEINGFDLRNSTFR